MPCIICGIAEDSAPVEHIVPESLGNRIYTLKQGALCAKHNNMFSEFESKALGKTILGMERARSGVKTKKGKAPTAQTGTIRFTGDENSKKNFIHIQGLTPEDLSSFDPATQTFKITVKSFDKAEVATSKLMLKMGLESLYESKKGIYQKYLLDEARLYLDNKSNNDWPFLLTDVELSKFQSIPTFNNKHELGKLKCRLLISEVSDRLLLFKFDYLSLSIMINLINRDPAWMKAYFEADRLATVYPSYMKRRITG